MKTNMDMKMKMKRRYATCELFPGGLVPSEPQNFQETVSPHTLYTEFRKSARGKSY